MFLHCLNFCHTSRETPEPPGDGNSEFFVFFVNFLSFVAISCSGLLKAPALTGYVGEAQRMPGLLSQRASTGNNKCVQ